MQKILLLFLCQNLILASEYHHFSRCIHHTIILEEKPKHINVKIHTFGMMLLSSSTVASLPLSTRFNLSIVYAAENPYRINLFEINKTRLAQKHTDATSNNATSDKCMVSQGVLLLFYVVAAVCTCCCCVNMMREHFFFILIEQLQQETEFNHFNSKLNKFLSINVIAE